MQFVTQLNAQVQTIDVATLRQWLEQEAVTLVDVREAGEYASERIPGAMLQPLSQFNPQHIRPVGDRKLVLYCQSGNRSNQAANRYVAAGYGTVFHLQGGLAAWKAAGQTSEQSRNAPISLMRQVQIVAGSLVLTGTILGATVSPRFLFLSGFVGAGLVFSGVSNTCAMGTVLGKLPYNQVAGQQRR